MGDSGGGEGYGRSPYLEILGHTIPDVDGKPEGIVIFVEGSPGGVEFIRELPSSVTASDMSIGTGCGHTTSLSLFPFMPVFVFADSGVSGSIRPVRRFFIKGIGPMSIQSGFARHTRFKGSSSP